MLIGYVIWALILGGLFAWEGFTLANDHDRWPTFSDAVKAAMRNPAGRWIIFAVWLWIGWHFFVRGWRFFLRS